MSAFDLFSAGGGTRTELASFSKTHDSATTIPPSEANCLTTNEHQWNQVLLQVSQTLGLAQGATGSGAYGRDTLVLLFLISFLILILGRGD